MNEFKKLANNLLDLGKKNRLLNYKETGLRSINILNKNIIEIFNDIVDSKEYNILLIDSILERQKELVLDSDKYNILEYSPYKVYDIINPILKPRQLICYKKGVSQLKVLKSLIKEYKFSIAEKGINSLYICFGFIEYIEDKVKYKAPVLLIPIKINSDLTKITIKEAEDEIVLNPTLSYYFKQQYNIKLPEYHEDMDINDYLNNLPNYLNKDMELLFDSAIGIFSFLKMNMYNDLVNNEQIVLKNKNIQALIGNRGLNDFNINLQPYPVVNYDSSQFDAIKKATSGESFVLQGPPGSGKSQTITNIIASLIANDKHVLFVSEKLAALEVVYNNLKKIGLDDFAIEIHSNKASKREFINSLFKTAKLPKYNIEPAYEDDILLYNSIKENIEEYYQLIHQPIIDDKISIYDLIGEYIKIDAEPIKYKTNVKYTDINKYSRLIYDYSSIEKIGYDYRLLPFNGLIDISNEYINYEIENDLEISLKYLSKLIEFKKIINKYIEGIKAVSLKDIYTSFEIISLINQLNYKNNSYFIKNNKDELKIKIDEYISLNDNMPNISNYNSDILNLDIKNIYWSMKGYTSFLSRLFSKEYKNNKRKVLAYRNINKIDYGTLLKEISDLNLYKDNQEKIKDCKNIILKYYDVFPDVIKVKKDLLLIKEINDIKVDYNHLNDLLDCMIAYNNYKKEEEIYNRLASKFDNKIIDFYNGNIETIYSKINDLYLKRDKLRDCCNIISIVKEIEKTKQIDFLHTYLNNGLELNKINLCYKKTAIKSILIEQLDKYPLLSGFNHEQFERNIKEFIDLDEKLLLINRDRIISKCSQKRPDDVLSANSCYGILVHEYNKVKRNKPIRLLLEEIFDFILDIKPVFLMSPLSVSTYLASELNLFDCVIFDEASQIYPWDALGSIYRAKQCIIIGDSKQMPPTNFFNASSIDEEEYEDNESILDMASMAFSTNVLRWHYRSRSEELIAFSNRNFYDNTLVTIPQAKTHKEGFGIDFIYLKDGRYNLANRTNEIEAEKICDLVFEHFKNSNQSLGVVAFSKVQAELIEDLIERKKSNYPELLPFFDEEKEEAFFVKNLESVQGDERDRIIFSICYGYNYDNKFYQRFGPLNNIGGERRLNVAITRAKYNVTIVSSILAADIKESESVGVNMLKNYLDFSENLTKKVINNSNSDSLINSIKEFLLINHFDVVENYGQSSFKIPLAVKYKNSDDFIAAIMVDNKESSLRTTVDHNRLERLLLERLGWKCYHLYSIAWLYDNEYEKNELLKFLKENNDNKGQIDDVYQSYLEIDETTKLEKSFRKYEELSIEEIKEIYEKEDISNVITAIVKKESPISIDYLYKKIARLFDKKSVTKVIKNMVDKNIANNLINKNNFLWDKYKEDVELRTNSDRTIDEIAVEELKDGIYKIVKASIQITRRDCYKRLIEQLGYERLTESTKKRLDSAVIFLQLDGKIAVNDDMISI